MTDRMTPPPHAEPDQLTQQLVLAELRAHRRTAGPFTWMDAITLGNRTASLASGSGRPLVDSALHLLERTGHIELTHLPLRIPPRDHRAAYPTKNAGMISLHARLALTPDQTHDELDEHAAALQTIAARLRHLLEHGHDEGTPMFANGVGGTDSGRIDAYRLAGGSTQADGSARSCRHSRTGRRRTSHTVRPGALAAGGSRASQPLSVPGQARDQKYRAAMAQRYATQQQLGVRPIGASFPRWCWRAGPQP